MYEKLIDISTFHLCEGACKTFFLIHLRLSILNLWNALISVTEKQLFLRNNRLFPSDSIALNWVNFSMLCFCYKFSSQAVTSKICFYYWSDFVQKECYFGHKWNIFHILEIQELLWLVKSTCADHVLSGFSWLFLFNLGPDFSFWKLKPT